MTFAEWVAASTLGGFGSFGPALMYAKRALVRASEFQQHNWLASDQTTFGQIYFYLHLPALAIPHLKSAHSHARQLASPFWRRNATCYLALAYVLDGNIAEAESALRDAESAADWYHLTSRRIWWARAELALLKGEPDKAIELVNQLIATAPNLPPDQPIPWLMRLKGRAQTRQGYLTDAVQSMTDAIHGAEQRGALPLLWLLYAERAALRQKLGDSDGASGDVEQAHEIIDQLAATMDDADLTERFTRAALSRLPSVKGRSSRRAEAQKYGGLTAREREIAVLIARGYTNREIADTLVLGERTVETHVSNVLAKLNLSSRRQITAWVVEKGLA
jgi:DNA-binding CsgD family transcriptional regulator